MARNLGTFTYAANYEVKMQAALDPRVAVANKADLITKDTWPHDGDTIYLYEGLLVAVASTNEVYMLTNLAQAVQGINDATNTTNYAGWTRVDAGAATQVTVIDNLTTESSTSALSAKQGKVLMDSITTIEGKITSIYKIKGSVDTYENLPSEGNTAGDVYNVVAAYGNTPAGTNYVWNGTEWDALGGSIDLSVYYTKDEVDGLIQNVNTGINNALQPISTRLNAVEGVAAGAAGAAATNKTQLEALQANFGELSLTIYGNNIDDDEIPNQAGIIGRLSSVEELNEAQNTRLTNLEKLVSGGEAGEGGATLLEMVNTNTANIATLTNRVKANEDAISVLNGASTTAGSVDYKIEQSLAWNEVE